MIIAITTLASAVRWLVVAFGVAIMIELIVAFILVPEQRASRLIRACAVIIILGITINYTVRTPAVLPGALLYLAAYTVLAGEIVRLVLRRRKK